MKRKMRISDEPVVEAKRRVLNWSINRNYGSDEDIARVLKTGRNCLACRFCEDSNGIVYTSGDSRYTHLCNYEPDADLHFVWDKHVCRAFEWLDGLAPRAANGNRKIKI